MSLLVAVEVQGIRSVGTGVRNAVVIDFLSPLTVICGSNGAGKTTIIEALKYVTTGELPPGKMQSFIHDPWLDNKARVDASVKLKFRDINGRICVVTRRMASRALGVKGKVSTRSEECTIAVECDNGEWKSLSSKVIDSKKEILNLMGVPAAILDYIVFCHQEESTWPLDEPKKLKERFDEIFNVSGYVKAIDSLKREIKDNMHQLQILEARLPLFIRQKHDKSKLNNEYNELSRAIRRNEDYLADNQRLLDELKISLNKAVIDLKMAEGFARDYSVYQAEKELLIEQLELIRVPNYPGKIDDLRLEIDAIAQSSEFLNAENDKKRLQEQVNNLAAQLSLNMNEKEEIVARLNELKATEMMYEKLKKERTDFIETLQEKYNISDDSIESYFHSKIVEFTDNLKSLQVESEEQLACFQREIDNMSRELAEVTGQISFKDRHCIKLESDIETLKKNLEEVALSEERVSNLQTNIYSLTAELERSNVVENIEYKLDALKEKRNQCYSAIDALKGEIHARERCEEIKNSIDQKNEQVMKYKIHLEELAEKHNEALKEIFGNDPVEHPVGLRLSAYVRKLSKKLSDAADDVEDSKKELHQVEQKVQLIKRNIDQTNESIVINESKIFKVISANENVEARLAELNDSLSKSRKDLGRIDGCQFLYEQWEAEVKEKRCCPLCERSYRNINDINNLTEKINHRLSLLPKELEAMQKRVKQQEEFQTELMTLIPYVRLTKQLRMTNLELETDLIKAEDKVRIAKEKLITTESEAALIRLKYNLVQDALVDSSLMDNLWKSFCEADRECKLLKAEMISDSTDKQSLVDLRNKLAENEAKYSSILHDIDNTERMISNKNEILKKLNELHDQHFAISEKELRNNALVKSLKEKQSDLEMQKNEIEQLKQKLPILESKQKDAFYKRQKILNNGKTNEKELIALKNNLETSLTHLGTLSKRINQINNISDDRKQLETKLNKLDKDITLGNEAIRSLNNEIDNSNTRQERMHRLNEQLRKSLLKYRIEMVKAKQEKARQEKEPLADLRNLEENLRKKNDDILFEMERKKGEVIQQKARIDEIRKQLNSQDFLDVETKFKQEFITKFVTENVIKDLTTYIHIVDESIVQYHAKKMEEINEILGTLWGKVYRGNDIDRIQIRSESVDEGEKRKSYNYRVVMCVEGMEFDMPGRCSAGQKMLASILIRIALSDVFCDKCSVIALDEPTANLDVFKVENLGEILAEIIEARCNYTDKNFQLIVITHDDRFVEHLRQLCRPEWVYAISKDSAGFSRIKRYRDTEDSVD